MRTLILTLLLIAWNGIGAPQPTTALNPFSTNRPPQPVFGDNNVAISNRIAGAGGGTSWNFYGISPSTVARLDDVTNIAGNYIPKYNGPSNGQTATNLTAYGLTSPSGIVFDGTHSLDYDGFGLLDGANLSMILDGSLSVNGNAGVGSLSAGTVETTGLEVIGTTLRVVGLITNTALSPSKLVSTGTGTQLVSSAYSDADITALQAATNAFIRTNAGTGYFAQLYSPTNTALASNQVAATFKGLTGQMGDLSQWLSSTGATNALIASNGMLRLAGGSATVPGIVGFADTLTGISFKTAGIGSHVSILANGDKYAFTSSYLMLASGQSIGWNASSPINTGANPDTQITRSGVNTNSFGLATGTGNIIASNAVFNGNVGIGTTASLAKLHASNSTAQVALRVDQISTNDIAQFYAGTVLKGGVGTNGIYSLASNLVAPASITIGASPVNFTNTVGAQMTVYIDAVSVTGTVGLNGTTIFTTIGQNTVTLQPSEYVTLTFTIGTPTAKLKLW